jgi:hypothetical protein
MELVIDPGVTVREDVAVDVVVTVLVEEVVEVVVVRVVVVHPDNPDKIITPHIQIPNSHRFFLNIIQSPHRIANIEHQQADSYEDDSN